MTSIASKGRIDPSLSKLSQLTLLIICSLLLIFSLPVLGAKAETTDPSITAVIVDLSAGPNGQMQIFGSDFDDPEVDLGAVVLLPPHLLSEPGELIVALPAISPGDYKLTLRQGKNGAYQGDYDLTIGSVGPEEPAGADGVDGASGTDSIMITVASDQTVGQGGNMIGLGNQSNSFDDVALSSPVAGIMTRLAFTIKQNLGQGGAPLSPESGESVDVFFVLAPYNSSSTFPNSYGTPKITLPALSDFINA